MTPQRTRSLKKHGTMISLLCAGVPLISGCFPFTSCEHPIALLTIEGTFMQEGAPLPLDAALVQVGLFADSEGLGSGLFTSTSLDEGEFLNANGSLRVSVGGREFGRVCFALFAPPPEYPPPLRPDRIEFVITRGDCEQRVMVEINEDTVVDPTFPDETLVLRGPLEVPPCGEVQP